MLNVLAGELFVYFAVDLPSGAAVAMRARLVPTREMPLERR